MSNVVKFTQRNNLIYISYLFTYLQQCIVTALLHHNVFMRNIFRFNGFTWLSIPTGITKDNRCLITGLQKKWKFKGLMKVFLF